MGSGNTNTEPALTAAGITAAIFATLNATVSLGILRLAPDQLASVNVALGLIVPLVLGFWVRGRVTPV